VSVNHPEGRPVRVRFAPSPTGYLHVGGLRTALYNYCFARRHGGVFVLRIEDTDRSRFVPGAIENLMASLRWAGLGWDEGPDQDGPHAPYLQSERTALYCRAVDRLLADGHAYHCFCTAERLDAMRKEQAAKKQDERYDRTCHRLPSAEVATRLAAGAPHVVRLLVPEHEVLAVEDLVRGHVEFQSDLIDDTVLLKSDGFPTYHLANVVDDVAMGITHVIRGEEWLSSMPKHLLLYRFFGYRLPQFAHLPLLLNPDRSKLSKRQGDVAVEDYRDHGYFPEALINFVAFLGWNPGDEREIFSLPDLAEEFSIERVNKAGAVFNVEKLQWMNQQYLMRRNPAQLRAELRGIVNARGWVGASDDYLDGIIVLMRERAVFVRDMVEKAAWFFEDPTTYEEATVKKRWKPESGALLRELAAVVGAAEPFRHDVLHDAAQRFAESGGRKLGDLVHPLRLACTGCGAGPGLFELMALLGRETCLRRIEQAVQTLA
jgi:glutamyl-tRNA synthetase